MKRLITAALTASALVLAACGSTPEGSGDEDTTASARDMGPLAEFMGYAQYDEEASMAEMEEKQKKAEDLTASCMKAEGFEYNPNVQTWDPSDDPNAEAWKISGTREFAEKYGYGIAMMGANNAAAEGRMEEYVDPNQDILDTMSESERTAWYDALYGPGSGAGMVGSYGGGAATSAEAVVEETSAADEPAATESGTDTASADPSASESGPPDDTESAAAEPVESAFMPSPEEMGCSGKAQAEVWPSSMTNPDDEMNQMWEEFNRRSMAIEDDPELQKMTAEWGNCLADKGFPGHTEARSAQESLQKEWSELHGEKFTATGDGGYSIEAPETPVTPEPTVLEEFKQREIAQAVADFDCSVGLTETRQTLQFAMEEKFVEEYGEVLTRQRELENGAG